MKSSEMTERREEKTLISGLDSTTTQLTDTINTIDFSFVLVSSLSYIVQHCMFVIAEEK